ncbi:MAG: hypothetical protein IBX57_00150 [Gammaproteobacteria bacterium]|nr:hypothetical protein [Gammaproteobacteria bacterium]
MAVKDNSGFAEQLHNAASSAAPQEAPQQPRANQQTQSQGRVNGAHRLSEINSVLRRPISRSSGSEVVNRFAESFKQLLGTDNVDYQIHTMDNNNVVIGPMSLILVTMNVTSGGKKYVMTYTLIVEGSGDRLAPRLIPIDQNGVRRQIEIVTTPSELYSASMVAKIEAYLKGKLGTNDVVIVDAGLSVIPSEVDSEDLEKARLVLFNATGALMSTVENIFPEYKMAFNIGMVQNGQEKLTTRVDYHRSQKADYYGMPVRSDISLQLSASINDQSNDIEHQQNRNILEVSGFVDLLYAPAPKQNPNPYYQGQVDTTIYQPRFIITRSDTMIDANTMELQLLGLAQAQVIAHRQWAWTFSPNHAAKGIDITDIGAVGYEDETLITDKGRQRIDTKAKAFGPAEFQALIGAYLKPDLVYSMDIQEGGDLSWLLDVLTAAASGDHPAYEHIVEAADNLTGGLFSQELTHISGAGQFLHPKVDRVPMGYYMTDGVMRDIRDVDYLAVLNMFGKSDIDTVVKWSEASNNPNIPMEIRLEEQMKIIEAVTGRPVIKAYAQRVTFGATFLSALVNSCTKAGLMINLSNPAGDFIPQSQRVGFDSSYYSTAAVNTGFVQAPGQGYGVGGNRQYNRTRWGQF